MFAALSATNEAILRINSKEKLFQQVCDAARCRAEISSPRSSFCANRERTL